MNKATLMMTACALAAAALPAHAQTAAKATTAATVAEVVVTAERRSQSVQKSSLAISVINPEEIKSAGVTQARDLTKLNPGVQIGQGGPATQIYIRGVGDFGSTPITNPAVGVYVDGVYVARAQSIEGNFFDLERIEVVKGPQGTLYGRNASGGAINIITAKPSLSGSSGNIDGEVGNYNLMRMEGALNVKLSDQLAVRGAFQVVSRDGFSSQGFDDDHHEAFRLGALWKPTEDFSLRVTGDYEHVHGNGPAYVYKGPLDPTLAAKVAALGVAIPTDPRANNTDPSVNNLRYAVSASSGLCFPTAVLAQAASASGLTGVQAPQGYCAAGFSSLIREDRASDSRLNNKFSNLSAEANWNLGFATLTVVPGYRKVRNDYTTFPSLTYDNSVKKPEKSDTYSFETRLGNTDPSLTWVAGLYYFRENQKATTGGDISGWLLTGNSISEYKYVTQSRAAFGQVTYSVAEPLRLIVGLRYSEDKRLVDGVSYALATPTSAFIFRPGQLCYQKAAPCVRDTFYGDRKWHSLTGKVGVEYDLTPQNMLFATYATGQKAGGFNATSQLGATAGTNTAAPYNPEKMKAYEFGARNRFLDNRLQLNAEGFVWKYADSQQNFATFNRIGAPTQAYANAGRATMYGVDVDMIAQVTSDDTLRANVEYLHSEFGEFIYTSSGVTAGVGSACIVTAAPPVQRIDCSGRPLIRAPKWSGTASYTHTFRLDDGASIAATLSGQFASSRFMGVEYIPAVLAPSYSVADFSVTYTEADGRWMLGAYVRNIGDELVYTGSYTIPPLPSMASANLAPPRTWGVRFGAKF